MIWPPRDPKIFDIIFIGIPSGDQNQLLRLLLAESRLKPILQLLMSKMFSISSAYGKKRGYETSVTVSKND